MCKFESIFPYLRLNLRETMLKRYTTELGPRIWEIVPDYIKKSNSFEEFKLKIKLWNTENCPCRLCKNVLTTSWSFITCLLF